jgi:hypothetical protein
MLPRQPKDYAADVSGDGRSRNQFSNIILMLESGLGLDFFQQSVDKAVAHHAVDYHIKIEAGSSRATVLLLQERTLPLIFHSREHFTVRNSYLMIL